MISNGSFAYDVIIAHGPGCNDGATAAWSVWRTLPIEYRKQLAAMGGFYNKPFEDDDVSDNFIDSKGLTESYVHPNSIEGGLKLQDKGFSVVFVFIQPSEEVPRKLVDNKRVLILDLDMGDALVNVVDAASSVLLADHHDSTPLTLCKHAHFLFETNRHKFASYINIAKSESGATLAWKLTNSGSVHPFVEVVRIGDTWQWDDHPELHARPVLKSLHMRRTFRSFIDIEETFNTWDVNFQNYVEKGKALYENETALAKQIAKQCDLGFIQTNDGAVYTVAYTQANILHSEVGSMIKWYAQKRFKIPIHICLTWKYVSYRGLVSVSLRDGNPGLNLAFIARNIKGGNGKGGGHSEAAGFNFFGLENFHNFVLKSVP